MEAFVQIAIENLTSPMVLFFALGFIAALVRVDLTLPQPVAKTVAPVSYTHLTLPTTPYV